MWTHIWIKLLWSIKLLYKIPYWIKLVCCSPAFQAPLQGPTNLPHPPATGSTLVLSPCSATPAEYQCASRGKGAEPTPDPYSTVSAQCLMKTKGGGFLPNPWNLLKFPGDAPTHEGAWESQPETSMPFVSGYRSREKIALMPLLFPYIWQISVADKRPADRGKHVPGSQSGVAQLLIMLGNAEVPPTYWPQPV